MSQSNNVYCIYKHTSPKGKSYIGQTKQYKTRCRQHRSNYSECYAISKAIKKYGWDNFTHEILEENLTLDEANEKESFYIEFYNSLYPNGYNLTTGGENRILSDEACKRISKGNKGRKFSEEHRKNISVSKKGTKLSEETKNKIKEVHTGRKHSEESKKKMSESGKLRVFSDEHKKNIKLSKQNISLKTRQKMSTSRQGISISEETRQKLRVSGTGRKLSEETKEKIRQKALKRNHDGFAHTEEIKEKMRNVKRKTWHIIDQEENEIIIEDLKQFCIDNNLNYSSMRTSLPRGTKYKGYKFLQFIEKKPCVTA